MDKIYKHQNVEKKWYEFWEKNGYFTPKIDLKKKPFTIILPPPNANADLHMGHAMYVIEDIMIRYHRMIGDPTLWLPGADHAGFETQYVFEKQLSKEGKSRFDYDRETLYQMIWDFVQKNRGTMENQLRRLGFSLDWTRNTFTLNPKIINIVYVTFKKLYDEKKVYRSEKLVNYCTKCGTGFSDLEVVNRETEGLLYYIKYSLTQDEFITVATTRPETLFGDVAVMVHPRDKQHRKFIDKQVQLPLTNRKIPIITDEHVDRKFGTGAVKVTPFHDFNDEKVAIRHKERGFKPVLIINIFTGKMQNTGIPDIDGLRVNAAREKVIQLLEQKQLLARPPQQHKMIIKTCYKCGSILEPLPYPQWYIDIRELADRAIQSIKDKDVTFIPKRFEKVAIRWLHEFHDWNISRQIVWGIKIPVWHQVDDHEQRIWTIFLDSNGKLQQGTIDQHFRKGYSLEDIKNGIQRVYVPVFESEGNQPKVFIGDTPPSEGQWIQETDTFDTWFSSGQWPFATLRSTQGKRNKEKIDDFDYFYPTSVMETGYDILPWWVCRMIMLGLHMTGKIPFKVVYLHGLVRDAKGQKMSKSKGNVINPITMADLYGADSLRMALIYGTSVGRDLSISEDKIRGMRNFSNKLWNIGRFIKMNIENFEKNSIQITKFDPKVKSANLTAYDKKILTQLGMLLRGVTKNMQGYRFDKAAERLYEFIWHTFADKYIEDSKETLRENNAQKLSILIYVYLTSLKLLHPFMPFITEEIYNQLLPQNSTPLIISQWPKE